ncbi:MAG: PTS transporter subunit EIIC [Erysipelothrix sp.]|nr:PTS transporter subunit EIIC [Erysipelothrix sp.]
MGKFKIKFETIRFPLIILLITVFLRGLSNTILSQAVVNLIPSNFTWVLFLSQIAKQFSGLVIQYLPFLTIIKILSKKHNSERVVLMFIVSYFLFLTITMIIGRTNMPMIVYDDLFGLNVRLSSDTFNNASILRLPYRLGFLGAIIVGYVADLSYRLTRTRTKYGFIPYIDKDVLSLLTTLFFTLIAGVATAFIWPYFIEFIFKVFTWISNDITNPISTFVYGFIDRIFSILDLSNINRQTFWYTSQGGSWMNDLGENYVGDISIWTQQLKTGITNTGFGRFITPYYIINLFALPGFILGIYSTFTSKKQRRSYLSLAIIVIMFAFISDISLPIEIFLIVMAPMLYFFHLFIVSSLFALLQGLNLFLGFAFEGTVISASLGGGIDLLSYFQIASLRGTIISLIIIGLITAVIYYLATIFYYRYLSLGLINKFEIETLVEEVLEVVGGLENIEIIDSSPFRIDVELSRPQLFNYERLESSNISRVIETKTSYALYYGTASTTIRKEILLRKKMLLP